ncbi:MAG: PH domain-containing protein [Candidatus Saccharimonadales bacterium]
MQPNTPTANSPQTDPTSSSQPVESGQLLEPGQPVVEPVTNRLQSKTLEGFDSSESKLEEVHRSVAGLVVVYVEVMLGMVAGIVLLAFMIPVVLPNAQSSQVNMYLLSGVGILAVITWLALSVFTHIYKMSKLIISDENLTQIIQNGLFNRSVAELSLADVEDVSAHQNGIIASLFGYGQLEIQTAGASDNFVFKYCPRPNFYGKRILTARQSYLNNHRSTQE